MMVQLLLSAMSLAVFGLFMKRMLAWEDRRIARAGHADLEPGARPARIRDEPAGFIDELHAWEEHQVAREAADAADARGRR